MSAKSEAALGKCAPAAVENAEKRPFFRWGGL